MTRRVGADAEDDWAMTYALTVATTVGSGGALGGATRKRDDSYRRPANDSHRRKRPFGYAPQPKKRRRP